jgi:hypothetical protein
MNKLLITESDKNEIRRMYGIILEQVAETPNCSNVGCSGKYTGPEFQNGSDVAHKYSNTITNAVAAKLKELYKSGTYVKVNFAGIKLTTKGMGTGNVEYTVNIPFISVPDKCSAMTGFAHVGGWNHDPALDARKSEILNYKPSGSSVVVGGKLYVSKLKKTKQNLKEYFIQWKHSTLQQECLQLIQNSQQTNASGKQISIQGTSVPDLREKVKSQTKEISIDEDSIVLDMNSYKVTFKTGSDKIQGLSLLYDDVSSDTLDSRVEEIQKTYPEMEKIEDGYDKKDKLWWVLSIIK